MIADSLILELPRLPLQAKQLLPEYSGIYYVLDEANTLWYIGKAKNIRKRWQGKTHHRIYQLELQKKKSFTIYYEPVHETELNKIEQERIKKYHPHLNSSPVKTKKVRPVETLLRETLNAIADFAVVLGIEPPRQPIQPQINREWLAQPKILGLKIIHIGLDLEALKAKYQPKSIEAETALIKVIFSTRKVYASKWEGLPRLVPSLYRLLVHGYAVEVHYWQRWFPQEISQEMREFTQVTLAEEAIQALTAESLQKLQNQFNLNPEYGLHLNRLEPYHFDPIPLIFKESLDRENIAKLLSKISEDYRTGRRGIGSRSESNVATFSHFEELTHSPRIEFLESQQNEAINLSSSPGRIKLCIRCFSVDLKKSYYYETYANLGEKHPVYQSAQGILNGTKGRALPYKFETVYLLATVEKSAWVVFQKYLKDFAKPLSELQEGEGYINKFYVSPRKYVVPAKVNIKLERTGVSAWIPFGMTEEFISFESATEEIRQRLEKSGLPELKIKFSREKIDK